ncbi:MAG TPA: acetyl-CoA carboxylase biotin carboxyl carrier protein [Vicinamibacterales bacterium]|jgi:acetyl-CoA carboxylase biotin carboxyl carrier protein|nr:acetyl-CoA carboxylase biotin carboxyl carrier protein [Vicinamibacterales bacterium]
MDIDYIKQILALVRENDLAELEIEHEGLRLKIRKDASGAFVAAPVGPAAGYAAAAQAAAPSGQSGPVAAGGGPSAIESDIELAVVKSPIVGTFYRCPEPGAASFVEVGATVKKGQVLCIIEAMKLMNEIDSDYDGEVVNCYVENGQAVQYGERLFAIRQK